MKFYQKTWFIILTLLIFAPIGIFLLFKYTSWAKSVKIVLAVISLIIFIPILIAALSDKSSSANLNDAAITSTAPSLEPDSEPEPSPSPTLTPIPSPSPITVEDQIIDAANKAFGQDDVISVEYTEASHYTCIKARVSESFTANMTMTGIYLGIADTLEYLQDLEDINIDFNLVMSLVDKYGNVTDETVVKASFYYETRSNVNWDYFLVDNIPEIADIWWIHNAL